MDLKNNGLLAATQFFWGPKTAAGSFSPPVLVGLVPVLFMAPVIARFPKEAPDKP
jgi:hypothetical protein